MTGIDAMIDGPPIVDDGCLRDGLITVCLTVQPTQPLILTSVAIDTDTSELCAKDLSADSAGYCVLAGTTITIPAGVTVSAHGGRPLVFASLDTIIVAGTIDVAGHQSAAPQATGPGAGACDAGTVPTGSGGGHGGSFGSIGGVGGDDSGAGKGGAPASFTAPAGFRGGCPGQGGGNGSTGGGAGGAVALLAKTAIQIDGTINASGGGGSGTPTGNRGGSGGGAGGMIVIDAPSVTGNAKIYANGGSGSEGAGGMTGRVGLDPTDPTTAAPGGAGGSSGGDGGLGAIQGTAAAVGTKGASAAGGGGGGGGVGVIHQFQTQSLPGMVSPTAS